MAALGAARRREFDASDPSHGFIGPSVPERATAMLSPHAGRGARTLLLAKLLAAAARKYRAVSLSVRQSDPAVPLFARLGFEEVPRPETANRVGAISFIMKPTFDIVPTGR